MRSYRVALQLKQRAQSCEAEIASLWRAVFARERFLGALSPDQLCMEPKPHPNEEGQAQGARQADTFEL
ncbi:hypothetical protein AAFF_G00170680 [Aldrovandia affinis]|uniref:Uncharacterized protein n=1 Tax=Aldrovandia affinis TaxID=143900 RepID=A0AAD7RL90_9TELE|nr:hypothetical protein AAFF_G00170680 [Aldrovandia affinis]